MIIDEHLDIDYQDSGRWRSYHLSTDGDNLQELTENADIFEIDQDGGEITNYELCNASNEVIKEASKVIADFFENYDPTPWCSSCGSMTSKNCDCGPIADND